MANIILIKGKTTTGAPSLAQLNVREMCFVIPDNCFYIKKDAGTIVGPFVVGGASGDMLKSIYDSTNNGKVDLAENAEKLGGVIAADYATNASVTAAINALVNSSPGALDTLKELATALGDDPNFASTVISALALKLDANSTIDGGTF
jgi:hypothetical protein